jgi:hypothetical protein
MPCTGQGVGNSGRAIVDFTAQNAEQHGALFLPVEI